MKSIIQVETRRGLNKGQKALYEKIINCYNGDNKIIFDDIIKIYETHVQRSAQAEDHYWDRENDRPVFYFRDYKDWEIE